MVYRFIIKISRSSSVLGKIEQLLTELWSLDFEKFQYCSFHSFSLHWLHILKLNLVHVYRFIIRISRSSSVLCTTELFLTEF
jgi:hypothetical protein